MSDSTFLFDTSGEGRPRGAAPSDLRQLPSVDALLRQSSFAALLEEFPRGEVLAALRSALDQARRAIRGGQPAAAPPDLALQVRLALRQRAAPNLRRVINATGIVLHTGLGRAPLAPAALDAVADVAGAYCNLELELESGERGDRHEHVRGLLTELCGVQDALVVNNNAAATLLALRALAAPHDVIVSRGQLVEIGGSYRMPEIMAAAGCRLVEVGTTNRTRISDYERALTGATRVLLRVHPSNYRVVGFTEQASLADMVRLARKVDPPLLVIDDLGSGLLDEPGNWIASAPPRDDGEPEAEQEQGWTGNGQPVYQLPPGWDEPTVRASVADGAAVVLFSGDKLLGGPQAGILVGRADCIERCRRDPLMRAMRPDKLTLAALEATLRLYRDPRTVLAKVPTLHMLLLHESAVAACAQRLEHALRQASGDGLLVERRSDCSAAGGGALPAVEIATWVVRVHAAGTRAIDLAQALRTGDTPLVARVQDEMLVLDCRTLVYEDLELLAAFVAETARELQSQSPG